MVTKTKKGKQRLDKYYYLAKEQGYRSRSAFKLIQLLQNYNFLQNATSLIDLCAAPGGWLQAAQKYLPMSSQIIGVDITPIKPIKGVVTIQADITTATCRSRLKAELNNERVDVVLHDGSPNVGTNWLLDAYSQNELVLSAAKLAAELLKRGGTFISKVFRSSDYNSLLWLLQQLFNKVEATKPKSSRNESAEMYFICFDYKFPAKIDERFWDPKFVFLSIDDTNANKGDEKAKGLSALLKLAGKRNRGGYEEGDDYRECTVEQFIESDKPVETLLRSHKITFPNKLNDGIHSNQLTTQAILEYCNDLKVLGKRELRDLLKWRFRLKKQIPSNCNSLNEMNEMNEAEVDTSNELKDDDTTSDSDTELTKSLDKSKTELQVIQKQKDKLMKKKMKMLKKQNRRSDRPMMFDDVDMDLFTWNASTKEAFRDEEKVIDFCKKIDGENVVEMDEEGDEMIGRGKKDLIEEEDAYLRRLDVDLEVAYELQKERLSGRTKSNKKQTRREKVMEGRKEEIKRLDEGLQSDATKQLSIQVAEEDSDEEASAQSVLEKKTPLIEAGVETIDERKTDRWFDDELFKLSEATKGREDTTDESECEAEDEGDDAVVGELKDDELEFMPLSEKQKKKLKNKKKVEALEKKKKTNNDGFDVVDSKEKHTFEEVPADPLIAPPKSMEELAEIQALGSLMIHRQTRMDLLDGAFNRYAFDDAPLPRWFDEDEKAHNKPQLPVTKELMKQYRQKIKEINARPIRKVLEASARKKKRFERRLSKVRKEVEKIEKSDEFNEASKAKNIRRMMRKAKAESKREKVYVVSRRPGSGKTAQNSKSSKNAEYKMVDRRLKKDKRSLKVKQKKAAGVKKFGRKKNAAKRK